MNNLKIMEKKVILLRTLKRQKEDIEKQIGDIESWFKEEMENRGVYELKGGEWKITWNPVSSSRFNQSKFKEENPVLFESYKEISESRRFLLS